MNALLRSARIIVSPDAEWQTIATEEARPRALLASFVLPMSLIPGAGWSLGLLLFGDHTPGAREPAVPEITQILHVGLTTSFCVVLWIGLSAAMLYWLAPAFGGVRAWRRALQVAAYSAAPVLLCGVFLVMPDLMAIVIIAFFHSLYLQYAGVPPMLQIKASAAAEFVAVNTMAVMLLSTILGAAGSWLRVL